MSYTGSEIAARLNREFLGNGEKTVERILPIDRADKDSVTFAVDARALEKAINCPAAVVLGPEKELGSLFRQSPPQDRCLILSPNPYADYGRMVSAFFHVQPALPSSYPSENSSKHSNAYIHPSAQVHESADIYPGAFIGPGVTVGEGTRIYPGVTILDKAAVGANATVYPNVTIREFCSLGDRVIVQPGAVIGGDGFGFARDGNQGVKIPQIGRVIVQDDVEIGANVTIDRGAIEDTVIGSGTKIDNLVHIAHNCQIGRGCILVAQVGVSGSVNIGDGCTLAGQSGVVGHVSIGAGTTLAARGVVTNDIPPKSFVSGFPAKPHSEEKRIMAALRRLPEMVRLLRQLAPGGKVGAGSAENEE